MDDLNAVQLAVAARGDHDPHTDWRKRGACRNEDPDLFFPVGTTGPALLQIEEAKAICRRRCPVMEQCLTWALEVGEEGVWGGLSEDERRLLKRHTARRAAQRAA
ncbi:WhiB family transcriptional regulator [Streptomyces sp. KL2]|uniref:WhiB family transcriptional regulator n=1 Tax=Streptomyces sp. KL2 TaxID=3050126 RepID=UPI00397A5D3F